MMEVRQITSAETRALRHLVLWPHIALEKDCVIDIDESEGAFHLGAFADGRLVSVGSFFSMSTQKIQFNRYYRLRAMATHPDHRGMHAGANLINYGVELLRAMQVEVLWCDARLKAVPFYEKLGFAKLPEVYDIPKIGPHHFMWKVL
jgi:predicted GNAT family N-acyltransferase